MKKASALILTLVAVMTACSKKYGHSDDYFVKQREKYNAEVSSSKKKETIEINDYYSLIVKYNTRTDTYIKNYYGIWSYSNSEENTSYLWSVANFHKDDINSAAISRLEGSVLIPENFVNVIHITRASNGQYVFIEGPIGSYITDAKKFYNIMYDSVFMWNTSLLCGAHLFLCASNYDDFFPQEMIDEASRNGFFITRVSPSIAGGKEICYPLAWQYNYVIGNYTYSLHEFSVTYVDYRLVDYSLHFSIERITEDESKKYITHSFINLVSIDYLDY